MFVRSQLIRFAVFGVLLLVSTTASMAGTSEVTVKKTNGCGCCVAWMDHLKEGGFTVTGENISNGALTQHKMQLGISQEMASCHTAQVEGYVIEGHVPAADIQRLLRERPDAIGLSVPGMPLGSPGMEFGADKEPFDVHLIRKDGTTQVFNSYPGN